MANFINKESPMRGWYKVCFKVATRTTTCNKHLMICFSSFEVGLFKAI